MRDYSVGFDVVAIIIKNFPMPSAAQINNMIMIIIKESVS